MTDAEEWRDEADRRDVSVPAVFLLLAILAASGHGLSLNLDPGVLLNFMCMIGGGS